MKEGVFIFMKVVQLEYFCAVSRYHSITQAAQKLYVTQPAISNAIRELEKEFSINLFARSKNHLTLTDEGEIFYQKASALLASIDETTRQLYDLGRQIPTVRIGIPPLLSTIFFPNMLQGFYAQHPGIPVELLEYASIRAADLVQEDVLDVALVNMHFYDIDKVNSYKILTERLVFAVAENHPLAGEKEISMEMLQDEPVILYNTDSVQNATLNKLFEHAGVTPKVIMRASQLYTINRFLAAGMGGAFLYESLLENMPGMKGILITPVVEQDIGLVWKKGKYINNSVDQFIQFVRKNRMS